MVAIETTTDPDLCVDLRIAFQILMGGPLDRELGWVDATGGKPLELRLR